MAAIGPDAAQQLVDGAARVGITQQQIAGLVRLRPDSLEVMSSRDRERVERMIDAEEHRQGALDRVLHLARLGGHDVEKIRAKVASRTIRELQKLAADTERYLNGQGIDTRTPAEIAAAKRRREASASAPAARWQVDRIVTLLAERRRSGEGGGYVSTAGLYDEAGNVDRAAVGQLTAAGASQLIDSLTENY